jgi:aldehyde:ferredoxin oxidoreductase
VETSEETLFEFAKRIRTLERAYDAGEGLTRDMEVLPQRFMDTPITKGVFKGEVIESDKFEAMKSRYYALREWDVATGIPTVETLQKLGLDEAVERLKGLNRPAQNH